MIFVFTVCTTLLRVFEELLGKTWNFTCQNLEIAGNNSLPKSKWVDQTRFCLILVSNRYVNLPTLGDHFWEVWMGDLCISLQRFALLSLECYFLKTCALFLAFYQGITRSGRNQMQLQKITLTFQSGGLALFEGRIDIYKFITTKNVLLQEIIHSVHDEHNYRLRKWSESRK